MSANVTRQTSQVPTIAKEAYSQNAADPGNRPVLKYIIDNKIAGIVQEDSSLSSTVNCEDKELFINQMYFSIYWGVETDVSDAKGSFSIGITPETEIQRASANIVIEAVFKRVEIAKRIEKTIPINERTKEFYTKYFQEKIDESTLLCNVLNKERPLLIIAGQLDEESSLNVLPMELILQISSHFPRFD
jgi:hypothetical protein